MKKKLAILACIFSVLTILSSCQKSFDIGPFKEIADSPLPGTGTYCRIESIWENPGTSDQRFFLISYDEFENPKFMTAPNGGLNNNGAIFRIFKYDDWHRLKEYILDYGNGYFEEWHYYSYDGYGRRWLDITYVKGRLLEKPVDYLYWISSVYDYDSHGRISRVQSYHQFDGNRDAYYFYNAEGNLSRLGATYDNKQNFLRTNEIWMFLHRDYSVNNPFIAKEYNSAGYPTTINANYSFIWLPNDPFRHTPDLVHSQISYGCRPSYYY